MSFLEYMGAIFLLQLAAIIFLFGMWMFNLYLEWRNFKKLARRFIKDETIIKQ